MVVLVVVEVVVFVMVLVALATVVANFVVVVVEATGGGAPTCFLGSKSRRCLPLGAPPPTPLVGLLGKVIVGAT